LEVSFTTLLVFRSGTPLSGNAKALLKLMRIQLENDLNKMRTALG
jgi:hypothetical protein